MDSFEERDNLKVKNHKSVSSFKAIVIVTFASIMSSAVVIFFSISIFKLEIPTMLSLSISTLSATACITFACITFYTERRKKREALEAVILKDKNLNKITDDISQKIVKHLKENNDIEKYISDSDGTDINNKKAKSNLDNKNNEYDYFDIGI